MEPPTTGIDEGTMKRTFLFLLIVFTSPLAAQDQDLVLITVNPCVIFDTRPAQGGTGAFAAEEERTFHIAGAVDDFAAQGGTLGGCGVPGWSGGAPVARAVLINYIAITRRVAASSRHGPRIRPSPNRV